MASAIICRRFRRFHGRFAAVLFVLLMLAGEYGRAADHRGTRIQWDADSLVLIQERAHYGRMLRLADGQILCTYSRKGKIRAQRSADNGRTWNDEVAAASFEFGSATNPELLLLQSGPILLTYNERPDDGLHPFRVMACQSTDQATTWTGHRPVYEAGLDRRTGCWEPAQIQLPSGEIQLFFANEKPYTDTNEQEITLLRSHDDGLTWTAPRTISFRSKYRDGMPVPLLLADERGIVVAIEDNGLCGTFKPAVVHTSLDVNWHQPPGDSHTPHRWAALKEPLPSNVYAGAPYLRQLATGETILSVQSGEGRQPCSNLDRARMVVYVGDAKARAFTNRSVPFDVHSNKKGLWNSLFIKDASTVTAISGATVSGVRGIWAIDGRVVRQSECNP